MAEIAVRLAMESKPIDDVLKNEHCELLSIGYNHPAYDGVLNAAGKPAFDEIEALYDAEKKEKKEKAAANGCTGAESGDVNRMRMANMVVADAMLPSQASHQLFQHNDTKTLDMYGN